MPTDNQFTKLLGWPSDLVYRHEINERVKTVKLGVRRERGNRVLRCPSCGPFQACRLKESLGRLWDYHYEGARFNYLQKRIDQLKWQRLKPFGELATRLLQHLEGIVNYCRTQVRFGVVEVVNGNIRVIIDRGRGYQKLRYLLPMVKRLAVINVEFIAIRKVKKAA